MWGTAYRASTMGVLVLLITGCNGLEESNLLEPGLILPGGIEAVGAGTGVPVRPEEETVGVDTDGDGIVDTRDNCPHQKNPPQYDGDSDGLGDVCDPDWDQDLIRNAVDNCPLHHNPNQADRNENGTGDQCETIVEPPVGTICGDEALAGNFTVRTIADIALLNTYTGITGKLTFELVDGIEAVSFECLESIEHGIEITTCCGKPGNLDIRSIAFPALVEIGKLNIGTVTALEVLSFPQLREVEDYLLVQQNPHLQHLDLPLLQSVGDEMIVDDLPLESLDLPELKDVGLLRVEDLPNPSSLDFPALEHAKYMRIASMGQMTAISANSLEDISRLDIVENPQLMNLSFPEVTTLVDGLWVQFNESLEILEIPHLTHVGRLDVLANANLQQIELPSLERLTGDLRVRGQQNEPSPPLEEFHLPALKSVDGDVVVSQFLSMMSLQLPALEEVGGDVTLFSLPEVFVFKLNALQTVGGVITMNMRLKQIELASLEEIGKDLQVDGGFVSELESLQFPVLHTLGGDLRILENKDMTQFSAQELKFIGGNVIFNANFAFAECLVTALIDQVEQAGGVEGVLSSSDNNADCICSEPPGAVFAMCF